MIASRAFAALMAGVLLVGLLLAPAPLLAAASRSFVTLVVNTQPAGEALALIEPGDVLVEKSAIVRLKIPIDSATQKQFEGNDFISLRSLGPKITYRFDENDLVVSLTLPPELFQANVVNMGIAAPSGVAYPHDHSAYVNYSVSEDLIAGPSGFAETGATIGAGRIYTSLFDSAAGGFRRGLTNLTFDSQQTMRTTIIGDTVAVGGDLGGNPYLAGIQVGRAFGLNPYFVQFPTLNFSGSMTAPGRADVYVNGVLVKSVELAPGQFSLQGIAPPNGASNTQVVITNSLGQSTVLGGAYYGVQGLLRKGLTDYQYSAGFLRPNAFAQDDRYEDFGWVGRYRAGITDDISAGARFEGTAGVLSGGPTLDVGTRFGSVHLGAAVSRSGSIRGAAADAAWGYSSRRFGLGANYQFESAGYATTSLSPQADRAISSTALSGSYSITPRTSVSVQISRAAYRDSGTQSTASAYLGLSLGDLGMTFGAARNVGTTVLGLASSGTSFFMTMMLTGKGRGSTMLASTAAAGKTTSTLQLQQGAPTGIGFGYRAAISNDPGSILTGDARYNGAIGTYDVTTAVAAGSRPDTTFTIAGGIADVDGKIALSRPLTNSFALVEVPGQRGVHVSLNGQDMGVTNRAGYLVVPDAVPYYDNRIRIDERATSFDTVISDGNQDIAPGIRSGALVKYGVRTIVAFTGKVLVRKNGADVVPAAGDFTLSRAGKSFASDLGDDGEFYFENLTAGEYGAVVRYAGGSCELNVTIKAGSKLINDVGTLVCDAER